jgi:hypothetical protein
MGRLVPALLLPGYEHQIVSGAGLSIDRAGKPKMVLHTTETAFGSLQFLINHWFQNWGAGLPHFIVQGKRCVQLLPLNVGAYTLENAPGGADTNRSGPAVQVEIVSYAANDWDDDTYETVGKLLADVKTAGHDFDLDGFPRFWGPNEGIILASYDSPIRFKTKAEYDNFNSWTDHAHIDENAHWDIGRKNGKRLQIIAHKYYDGQGEEPLKLDEDDKKYIRDIVNLAVADGVTDVTSNGFGRNAHSIAAIQETLRKFGESQAAMIRLVTALDGEPDVVEAKAIAQEVLKQFADLIEKAGEIQIQEEQPA